MKIDRSFRTCPMGILFFFFFSEIDDFRNDQLDYKRIGGLFYKHIDPRLERSSLTE